MRTYNKPELAATIIDPDGSHLNDEITIGDLLRGIN